MHFPQILRSLVVLGRRSHGGGFRPLGTGIVLTSGASPWLVMPQDLLQSAHDAPSRARSYSLNVQDLLLTFTLDTARPRYAIGLSEILETGSLGRVAADNPFVACRIAALAIPGLISLPEISWQPPIPLQPGMPCRTAYIATALPEEFGPVMLDGSICATQVRSESEFLTTVPTLPGGFGAPILVRNPSTVSNGEDWHVAGCLTGRVRISATGTKSDSGHPFLAEYFGVVTPLSGVHTLLSQPLAK